MTYLNSWGSFESAPAAAAVTAAQHRMTLKKSFQNRLYHVNLETQVIYLLVL